MKAKLVAEGTTVTYVVVLDQGEEAFSTLRTGPRARASRRPR